MVEKHKASKHQWQARNKTKNRQYVLLINNNIKFSPKFTIRHEILVLDYHKNWDANPLTLGKHRFQKLYTLCQELDNKANET